MAVDTGVAGRGNASVTVIEAVAEREGVPPTELDPPLYEVVDPDALDRLFGSRDDAGSTPGGCVAFAYCGYRVTVSAEGEVTVEDGGESAGLR